MSKNYFEGHYEQRLGPLHSYTAYPLHGLALLHQQQEKYEQAETSYRRALAIWEHLLGSGPTANPETQATRKDSATFLRLIGRDEEAN